MYFKNLNKKMNFKSDSMILICFYLISYVASKYCYWKSENIYKQFSSKTPYNNVRGDIRDSLVTPKGCEPASVWALIRHGKRTPTTKFAKSMREMIRLKDDIIKNHHEGKSELCAQDVENLRNWSNNELFEIQNSLTKEGYEEMLGIGRRLKEALGTLLVDLEIGSYSLRPAFGEWIEVGVGGFVEGMSEPLVVEKSNSTYDIMAPYEACDIYMKQIRKNPNTYNEANKYENSIEYTATIERIQKRIGIEYKLTKINISSIYDLCRYSWSGIYNRASPWCALLSTEDLKVIEYYGDLRHYYRNGHGFSINELFGQISLADLYKTFRNIKSGKGKKLTVYFTHATMMDMTYAALGWFKDAVPLSAAYRDPNRKWKSSKLAPFAGNLISVLYRCSEDNKEHFKVMFYLNEDPVTSICEKGVCSWQEFENKFKPFENSTLDFCL